MPRNSRPWFRLYVETIDDWKIRRLTPSERWVWISMLAFARKSVRPGYLVVTDDCSSTACRLPVDCSSTACRLLVDCSLSDSELASYADVPLRVVKSALQKMERSHMIEKDPDLHAWHIIHFNERQFESDNVNVRTSKHRSNARRRNVPTSNVGTPISVTETDTDTDTDTEVVNEYAALDAKLVVEKPVADSLESDRPKVRKGSRVPEDFAITEEMRQWARVNQVTLDLDAELESWKDFWRGVSGREGVKLDWVATWRNGMKSRQQRRNSGRLAPPQASRVSSLMDQLSTYGGPDART